METEISITNKQWALRKKNETQDARHKKNSGHVSYLHINRGGAGLLTGSVRTSQTTNGLAKSTSLSQCGVLNVVKVALKYFAMDGNIALPVGVA